MALVGVDADGGEVKGAEVPHWVFTQNLHFDEDGQIVFQDQDGDALALQELQRKVAAAEGKGKGDEAMVRMWGTRGRFILLGDVDDRRHQVHETGRS